MIRNLFIVHHQSPDLPVTFQDMTTCQVCGCVDCSSGTVSDIMFNIDMRPEFKNYMVIKMLLLLILFAALLVYIWCGNIYFCNVCVYVDCPLQFTVFVQ
jgi:hypothetical protein